MRTINRVIATGSLILPLTFGAAGMASADTQPVHEKVNTPGVTDLAKHGAEGKKLVDGVLNGVLGTENAPGHHDGTGNQHGQFQTF